jgi:two-component system cell cycle sensor histidine kinase/response regulator CckA
MSAFRPTRIRWAMRKLVNLSQLVKESTALALTGSGVGYDFDIPADLWPAEADEGQVDQVVHDLVINARQAIPQGGLIKVSAQNLIDNEDQNLPLAKGGYVKITVEGLAGPVSGERLAESYGPDLITDDGGAGLALSYSIIREHGGCITRDSEPGKRMIYRIFLPASIKPMQSGKEAAEEVHVTGTGRILVVDDEEEIRRLLEIMLTRAGYRVEQSWSGEEAVAKYIDAKEAGKPFAAVIMDLTMPGNLGGREATHKILEVDPEARVIVSSGYSSDPAVYNYQEYGFSGAITKPYVIDQLEAEMNRVIAAGSS